MLLCGLCKESFLSNDDLKDHLEQHASQLFESDEEVEENEIKSEQELDQDSDEGSLVLDCVKEEEQLQGQQDGAQEGNSEGSLASETFMCSKCSFKTINKDYFKLHMNQMHLNKYKCGQCPKKFTSKGRLEKHLREKHMKDEDIPKQPEDEFFCIKVKGQNKRLLYECVECALKTECRQRMYRHIQSAHRNLLVEVYKSKGLVSDYIGYHKCTECCFKALTISRLEKHIKAIHHKKLPKTYFSESHHEQHSQQKHMKDEDKQPEDEFYRTKEGKRKGKHYECVECSFKIKGKAAIYRHIRGVHRNLLEELYKSKGMVLGDAGFHKCTECFYKTLNMFNLKQHIKTFHQKSHAEARDYVCDLCNKAYSAKGSLFTHLKSVHYSAESSELHKCSICSFKTTYKNVLKTHLNSVHLKIRSFTCDLCKMQFSAKHVLQRHIEGVHLKKTLSCEHDNNCSFRTTEKAELLKHIQQVHKKNQGFSCEFCGKWYGTREGLKYHRLKTQHITKEDPSTSTRLTCDLCQNTTKNRRIMYKHMQNMHLKKKADKVKTGQTKSENQSENAAFLNEDFIL